MIQKAIMWIVNNWAVIIAMVALVVVAIMAVRKFLSQPTDKQKAKILKCLLGWVIDAERDLGSGTGKVKLSVVYGAFVTAFPILKNFVSLETFSDWVDEALDEMRKMLEGNENLKAVVEGNILMVGVDELEPVETEEISGKE